MEENIITSTQNARIKHVVALQQKSSLRREEGLFVVEGQREIEHCIACGYEIEEVYVLSRKEGVSSNVECEMWNENTHAAVKTHAEEKRNAEGKKTQGNVDRNSSQNISHSTFHIPHSSRIFPPSSNITTLVTSQVYEKMAYRDSTEGIIAVAKVKDHSLKNLRLNKANPLIVVLESVEKPGNLGAILRTSEAANVDAVIVCDPLTDVYNPNLIRASIGGVFSVPIATCSSKECITFLKENKVRILTAQLQDSYDYYDYDMRQATALVMGTESTGLSQQWREAADAHIRIPMLGRLDSLNVSVSTAILIYEAVRQRNATYQKSII